MTAVTANAGARRFSRAAAALRSSTARIWLGLLALTAATAVLALHGAPLHSLARDCYPTAPRPPHRIAAAGLFAHNLVIALVPVALWAVRWHTSPAWRRAGDVLIGVLLVRQAVFIGLGIGAWPQILPNLPHLPVEFAGLAAGAGAWLALSRAADRRRGLNYVALTIVLLMAAAIIEVVARPR